MTDASAQWTDDRVAQLRRLWTAGASAAQIAVALNCGLSRNAVIGKARRLKLEARLSVVHRAGRPKVAPPELTRSVRKLEARLGKIGSTDALKPKTRPATPKAVVPMARPQPALPAAPVVAPGPLGRPLTLAQLDSAFRKCRWIVHRDPVRAGGDLYCGAPTLPGRSWCCHHNDLACDRSALRHPARSAVHARAAE